MFRIRVHSIQTNILVKSLSFIISLSCFFSCSTTSIASMEDILFFSNKENFFWTKKFFLNEEVFFYKNHYKITIKSIKITIKSMLDTNLMPVRSQQFSVSEDCCRADTNKYHLIKKLLNKILNMLFDTNSTPVQSQF